MAASMHSLARILPFAGEHRSSIVNTWPVQAERRVKFRYPVDLRVRFRFALEGSQFDGRGLARNMSSGGILIATRHQVVEGALLELNIEWPSLLNGNVPLQLVAMGRVLRRGKSSFAAAFEGYEFRTMKIPVRPLDEAWILSQPAPDPNPQP
jgi:hypothetical protein